MKQQAGLNRGGLKKHRKILRDNIQGVTKGAITRLARKAGAVRLSGLMYEEIRGYIKVFLSNLLRKAITFTEHRYAIRVSGSDVRKALQLSGYGELAETDSTVRVQRATARSPKRTVIAKDSYGDNLLGKEFTTCGAKPGKAPPKDGAVRRHRFRPGIQAVRQVKYYQKQSSCFSIGKMPFQRLIREVAQDFKDDLQFTEEAFHLIQLATENYIINLMRKAVDATVHAERKTIFPKDVQFASKSY